MIERTDNLYTVFAANGGPVAIGITIIVALWLFRAPLIALLNRIKTFSTPGGLNASFGEQIMEQTGARTPDIAATLSTVEAPIPGHRNDVFPLVPGNISTHQVQLTYPFEKVDFSSEDTNLRRAYFWYGAWVAEMTYRMIHGTQLQLLLKANSVSAIKTTEAREFYSQSVKRGNTTQSFEQWIGWLLVQTMLEPSDDSSYTVTPAGRMFVRYVIQESYPLDKGF